MEARRRGKKTYIAFTAKLVENGKVTEDMFPGWRGDARQSYGEVVCGAKGNQE